MLGKVTYDRFSHLQLLQHPCCHVIKIQVLVNWHVFIMDAASRGHVITICDLPSQLPTSKVNGGSRIHFNNHMIHLMTVVIR